MMKDEVRQALKELLDESNTVEKTAAMVHNATVLHGQGGLFSNSLERDVITAHMRPFGIGSVLPIFPTVMEDPRFGSITGFTADVGAEPVSVCYDAPSNYIKGCNLTARLGLLRRDTNTIDFDKVMLTKNRGDFRDLILRGRLLGMEGLAPGKLTDEGVLDIITKAEMVGAGVSAERLLSKQLWQGTLASGGFPGLDLQIATGQKDADTGILCPALDSDIKDFNYADVAGVVRDIVEYLSMLTYFLAHNAQGMGLEPTNWVIVMRPELWFELSSVWPCRYLSNRCTGTINAAGGVSIINDNVNISMRDNMRNGMFIDINGIRYPVITDTGIFESNNVNNANLQPGQYASSIYVVPLNIQGNFPVTYREYLDYRQGAGDVALLGGKELFWTDDGIYSWAIEQIKWCYKLSLKTEQRVILRTPQLAGKIQRVRYTPLQHLRDPYPESSYFADGGVSVRGSQWGKAVWS